MSRGIKCFICKNLIKLYEPKDIWNHQIGNEMRSVYVHRRECKATADNSDFKTASPKLKHS